MLVRLSDFVSCDKSFYTCAWLMFDIKRQPEVHLVDV